MLAKVGKSGNPIHDTLWKYAIIVCILSSNHVIETLWMEGVWPWENHIQVIHSQSPILWSIKILRQPEKKTSNERNFGGWKINACKMKWLIIHLIVKIVHRELREPYGNLQNPTQMLSYNWLNLVSFRVDGYYPWFYLSKGRGRSPNPLVGTISSASPFYQMT